MEGKLIKQEKEYYALYNNEGVFISDVNGGAIANRLSLKNCQAIANGYDLVELACNEIGIDISVINHIDNKLETDSSPSTPIQEAGAVGAGLYHQVKGFEIGFQKALELLGDKKFSEDDVRKAIEFGMKSYHSWKNRNEDEFIQSLQPTEWDVEIEMEENCPYDYTSRCTQGRCDCKKPKLDAGGCLILKRK